MAAWNKEYHWRATWPKEGHEEWTAFDGAI